MGAVNGSPTLAMNQNTGKARSYWGASKELRRELGEILPREELKALHQKDAWCHFVVAGRLALVAAICIVLLWRVEPPLIWIPLSIVLGFCYFNFTVLLHEVVHNAVFERNRPRLMRILGLAYAIPSGISSSQFTRWHLDHHDNLGDSVDDPKRHWLSPKRRSRWVKLLYWTPLLIPIYFRAARKENAGYDPALRRTIAWERALTMVVQLGVLAWLVGQGGWGAAIRIHLFPYLIVFPVAFSLNRVGQHYDIDPDQVARWSTRVDGNAFWQWIFLYSNFHLEHHYFQNVPFYRLTRLNRLLRPYFEERKIPNRSYGVILRGWLVRNELPHTRWS